MKNSKLVMAAALAAVVGMAGVSQAVTVTSTVLTSGDVEGGWRITFPVGIALAEDSGSNGVNLVLEKTAAFDSLEGLDITFTQVGTSATSTITITDESVTNVSGSAWSGFQFLLLNTLPGNAAPGVFAPGEAFAGSTPPFDGPQSDTPDDITLGGGTLGNTDTAKWGFGAAGGDLVIEANPATTGEKKVLDFKEIPIVAAVPLPAAGWTGLSGLVGLGLIAGAKRVRRLMA